MKVRTGVDIVEINEFKFSLQNGGERFLSKIFSLEELKNSNPEHLAGLFAAKEAVVKALNLKAGSWLAITIVNEPSGRPKVKLAKEIDPRFPSFDLSISHTQNYAVALFVALSD